MKPYTFTRSYEMFEEAKEVIPGGIYGPRSPTFLTFGSYPAFLSRGEGCRIWDVDGNEYIDYMCSFGTNVLGLRHPKVEAAARAQMEKGDCFTIPSDRWIEAAHAIVDRIEGLDWTVFSKNGTDVTNYAVRLARVHTNKRIILTAQGSYHGNGSWCVPMTTGIPEEYLSLTKKFNYNDPDSVRLAFEENAGDVACAVITPMRHDTFFDIEYPSKEFLAALRECCDQEGALLISDDIRCGFRLDMRGSHVFFGYEPDVACFGKAMANGYPIAAALGKAELKESATMVFFTGTHFFSAVPMAAMIASLQAIEEENAIAHIEEMGNMLKAGMESQAREQGVPICYSGPPSIPFMTFKVDNAFDISCFFGAEASKRGVFLHPHHNWFLCAAHKKEDIEKTLEVTGECFRLTGEKLNNG